MASTPHLPSFRKLALLRLHSILSDEAIFANATAIHRYWRLTSERNNDRGLSTLGALMRHSSTTRDDVRFTGSPQSSFPVDGEARGIYRDPVLFNVNYFFALCSLMDKVEPKAPLQLAHSGDNSLLRGGYNAGSRRGFLSTRDQRRGTRCLRTPSACAIRHPDRLPRNGCMPNTSASMRRNCPSATRRSQAGP